MHLLHKWEYIEFWYPSIDALVVQGVVQKRVCIICGKEDIYEHFDFKEAIK